MSLCGLRVCEREGDEKKKQKSKPEKQNLVPCSNGSLLFPLFVLLAGHAMSLPRETAFLLLA